MKAIIFTDLDASLLHEETFSCVEIIDTLKALQSDGVLIVPNTSKTEIETRNVLKSINFTTPFIVENGAKFCDIHHMSHFIGEMDEAFGIPVSELNIRLKKLGGLSFHNDFQPLLKMERDVAAQILGLSGAALEQALNRRYSLLFRYTGPQSKIPVWHDAVSKVGLSFSQGGRVFALSGPHNKATPIQWFSKKLISMQQTVPKIIAIGDSNNDKPMLLAAAIACVIPGLNGSSLALPEHPSVVFAEAPAPFGWRAAAKKALDML